MKTPVTNATLNSLLTAYKKVKGEPGIRKPVPVKKQIAGLQSIRSNVENDVGKYTKPDLEKLIDELRLMLSLAELYMEQAPEGDPKKKPPPGI